MSESDEDWDADFADEGDETPLNTKGVVVASLTADSESESEEEESDGELDSAALAATLQRKFGITPKSSLGVQGDAKKPTLITPEMFNKIMSPGAPSATKVASTEAPPKDSPTLPRLDLQSDSERDRDRDRDREREKERDRGEDAKRKTPREHDTDLVSEALVTSLKNIKQVAQLEAKSIPRLEQNFLTLEGELRKSRDQVRALEADLTTLRTANTATSPLPPHSPSLPSSSSRSILQILFLTTLLLAVVGTAFFIYETKRRQAEENTFEFHEGL